MSEWLTTGEMIDRLKAGEIAECSLGDFVGYVTKISSGAIVCCEENGEILEHDNKKVVLTLSSDVLKMQWRILTRYVSFEEAMKALREGKTVSLHIQNKKQTFSLVECIAESLELDENYLLSWEDLFYGKWTIEDDAND
jgi:hypothetical protein